MTEVLRFEATLERKQDDLPVFLIVPETVPRALGAEDTVVVEAAVAGQALGRRSIKPWGDGRWFMELTRPQMERAGLEVGMTVGFDVRPAPAMPDDLEAAIAAAGLGARWSALSEARRRACAETVFEARRPPTRSTRIERILAMLAAD